jgi:hypothetical protein
MLGAALYLRDHRLTPSARQHAKISAAVRFQEKWRGPPAVRKLAGNAAITRGAWTVIQRAIGQRPWPFVTEAFQLKLITASVAQPITCTKTFCTPGATWSRSTSEMIILAVKEATVPSPWR